MTKKDTTGLPNRRNRDSVQDERAYLSRAERESRAQKWLLLALAVTLGVMLIVLVVGIAYEWVIYPNQAVAVVDGVGVSTTDFEARVRYERWALGQQLQNIAAIYGTQYLFDENGPFYQQFYRLQPGQEYIMGRSARDAMVEELLIRSAAEELGITATDEEVEARVQQYFGYDPNPEPEEVAVPVEEDADVEAEEDVAVEEDADAEAEEDVAVEEDADAEAEEDVAAEEDADAEAEAEEDVAVEEDADAEAEEDVAVEEDADAEAEEDVAAEEDVDAEAEEDVAAEEDADVEAEEDVAVEEDADAEAEEESEAESTPLPTLTPVPTLSPEERAEQYEEYSTDYFDEAVNVSGMSEAEIRAIFEVDVLREKLQAEVVDEVATTEEQVNARHILVETEEEAQAVVDALEEGQAFEDLAAEFSIDTGSAQNGGELGWAGPNTYVPEFEAAVWTGEVGEISEPVQSQYGYHIIEVLGHEDRELTASEIEQKESTAFSTWLQEQRLAVTIEYPNDYLARTPSDPTVYDLNLVGTVSQ